MFVLKLLASIAMYAATIGANSASMLLAYQPELPSELQ